MKESTFISFDGKALAMYVYDNVENPKGVVQIAHGMQEYSKTYFKFAEFLEKNGYYVVLIDERAHGKSVEKTTDLGQVKSDKDLFMTIVKDHVYLSEKIIEKTKLPLIYFGHSYGSFIGQKYIQLSSFYSKAILSGSSYMKTPLIKVGKILAQFITLFKGKSSEAKTIEKMSFKSYQKHFSDGSWITRDEEETKEFYSDEHNGTPFSNGFYVNMFKNQLKLYKKNGLGMIDRTKPLLLVSGDQDPVGEFSKGTKKLYSVYDKIGLNVRLKLFEGARHGVIQETNKQEVWKYILDFINKG